ncbi:MAG: toprim domain-containing protein [Pseudomonadota bacterium]
MLPDVMEIARGKWRSVLTELGVPSTYLSGKHGPCPFCGRGKDRWRFTDKDRHGMWICNQCGAGNGWQLLQQYHGWGAKRAADEIRRVCGEGMPDDPQRPQMTDEQCRKMLNEVWRSSRPVENGDMVSLYLRERGIDWPLSEPWPKDLRFCRECPVTGVPGTRALPAMVALVRDPAGKPATIHRTYLAHKSKAKIDKPKSYMPGGNPMGTAVRLGNLCDNGEMGIAEGIETALAASLMFKMPVWAALDAGHLGKWKPPSEAKTVHIFGDNDESFTGHFRTYELANRLVTDREVPRKAFPLIPNGEGEDWADVYSRYRREAKEEAEEQLLHRPTPGNSTDEAA